MKKERRNGTIYMISENSEKFINEGTAFMAAQTMSMLLFMQGYPTYCNFNKELQKLEVEAHFENELPKIPKNYGFNKKEITSHSYVNYKNEVIRVRTITFYYYY